MQYKAIGFDYGGVLAGHTGMYLVQQICALLQISVEEYQQHYHSMNHLVNLGGVRWPDFWEQFLEKIGQRDKLKQLLLISEAYRQELRIIQPDMLALVDTLREQKYCLGLLSNNSVEMANHMRNQGLDKHFDVFHISEEIGYMKPDPQAFAYFAQALSVKLKELIFIDDSAKSLSTAATCGYTPIQFIDSKQLRKALIGLGISLR